ncbi:hypothetical protein IDM33_12550 [Acinetobacter seifertii]|nr:hypothetical protein [Acinetobacter seifertii]
MTFNLQMHCICREVDSKRTDANGEKVTNVGAGTAATDAVNKGQLDALSTSSNNKTDA